MPSWVGVAILAIVIAYATMAARGFLREDRIDRWYTAYEVFLIAYGLGVAFKTMQIGPDILRFHLADFGWPGAISYAVGAALSSLFRYRWSNGVASRAEVRMKKIKLHAWLLAPILLIACAYEVLTGYAASLQGGSATNVGTFDWLDIVAACAGVMAALAVLYGQARLLKPIIATARAGEAPRR